MASERNRFAPPSYNYGMELTESPMSIQAPRAPTYSYTPTVPQEKYVMRDEERYPTVVEEPAGLIPYEPVAEDSSATSVTRNVAAPSLDDQMSIAKPENEPLPERAPVRTILGMPKKRFFMVMTVVGMVVLCLIIIGAAVGVSKGKSNTKFPSITAAGVFTGANNTEWKMHVVHAKTGSDHFSVKFNNGTGPWSERQSLNFTIIPKLDDPMTATSVLGNDGNIYLNLFYVHDENIVLANFSCIQEACTPVFNEVITKGITYPLSHDSSLESVYINSSAGYRIFYHNSDKYVTQLGSAGDGTWDHGAAISGKALEGSSISAAIIDGAITVLYVDDKDKILYNVQAREGRWRNPTAALPSAPFQWDALATVAASYRPGTDVLSVFYTGSDARIYELYATNASTEAFSQITRGDLEANSTSGISTAGWNTEPYTDLSWGPSDAPGAAIASLAWDNQARFLRLMGGKLAESVGIDGVWSANFM
ncbi:hypothetical protein ONS95_005156 [Cadophora gregata]|uniref:uncharacterized protein n=1 Tax=Cadophora gregata TaxID=51156 RepID=UPI0026DB962F|nr:uncharacterized protein ONS95_005156 [Cadophora gregata]KAK0104891.1 hypothetical protein ONS95_005156 [Cadophora gregata]KAK0115030.1 hypothetical protein ONS96_013500 [Cadophora gregata f. sp. sojae]